MPDYSDILMNRLTLPAYTLAEAAAYASVDPKTVRNWYGYDDSRRLVLGTKERGVRLSYMQLVEVAFVATFRRFGVQLDRIREARDFTARQFDARFPFAEFRFKTEGTHLLMDFFNEQAPADTRSLVIADRSGQLVWESMVSDRFAEFEYDAQYGIAIRWHVAGYESSVVIDPRMAFGSPSVRGIPTRVLRGRYRSGESMDEIVEDFNIEAEQVRDALAFEGIETAA